MKTDLSRKIIEYAKKILIVIIIMQICILSIGNSGSVYAEETQDKLDSTIVTGDFILEMNSWYQQLKDKGYSLPNTININDLINTDPIEVKTFELNQENQDNIVLAFIRVVGGWTYYYIFDKQTVYTSSKGDLKDNYAIACYANEMRPKCNSGEDYDAYGEQEINNTAKCFQMFANYCKDNKDHINEVIENYKAQGYEINNNLIDFENITVEFTPIEEKEADPANNEILKVLDGIAGVLFIGFKIVPIIIGGALELIMNVSTGEKITIYNLLFNKVGLTNINFFERADGNNADTVNEIRDNVAIWYVSLRNLAAVVLALVLIYVAIRMAISTIAEEKARYKKMLIDWLTSLCLLFVLHYIMVIIININNAFINVIGSGADDNLTDIGGALVSQAFSTWTFTEGVGCAVAYMMLVGMSFIYFFAYIKRMITLAFLIIISPLITITYSIDKMGDGKSQALNTWLKEFTYNILIQPFQCIIYLSLVGTVFKMLVSPEDAGDSSFLFPAFLSVYVLMFMFQAEEIVKNIFGFKSQSMGKTVASAAITGAVIGKATSLFSGKKEGEKKKTSGSDYKQRPRTKNTPNIDSNSNGQRGNSGQSPRNEEGTASSGQPSGEENGNSYGHSDSAQYQNTNGEQQRTNDSASGKPDNQSQGSSNANTSSARPKNSKKRTLLNGAKKLGKTYLRGNLNMGLRVAGLALGLSTGDLNTGIAGWGLGTAQANKINSAMKKHSRKTDEDSRFCSIANSIDDFQGDDLTNTQVMQRTQDWLDGISMPDRDDDAGLKLYQQLMEEQEIQMDQGKSRDDAREIVDQLIRDSLSGAQSRVSSKTLSQRLKNRFTK